MTLNLNGMFKQAPFMSFFQEKVVVITGSTQGIGFSLAEHLIDLGARVVINSRSESSVEKAVNQLRKKGGQVCGLHGDVSDTAFVERLQNLTLETFGKVDILINNAAIAVSGSLQASVHRHFSYSQEINLLGSIYPTQVFLSELEKTKGSILFVSSLAGIVGLPGFTAYSMQKRAILSLAESLRLELMDKGIFVGVCIPDFTENDPEKVILTSNGTNQKIPSRNGIKLTSRKQTSQVMLRQLRSKRFMVFTTYRGRALHIINRLAPNLTTFLLRLNSQKIMSSGA